MKLSWSESIKCSLGIKMPQVPPGFSVPPRQIFYQARCERCGAMVPFDAIEIHQAWHETK